MEEESESRQFRLLASGVLNAAVDQYHRDVRQNIQVPQQGRCQACGTEMLNDQGKLGRGESIGFFELLAFLCLDERLARFWFPLRKGEDASWDASGLHVVNKATGEITWSSAMGGGGRGATISIGVCCIPSRRL